MKHFLLFALVLFLVAALPMSVSAQWRCLYATYDDDTNGTGYNTPSVGVISEDIFVALVMNPNTRNFMIPYVAADSASGRVNYVGYGGATSGIYQVWTDGIFDQVPMKNAAKLIATPDSLVYVANNDDEHNILVFKFNGDTVQAVSPYWRQITGTNSIFGLAVDGNGYVYVCNDTTTGQTDDIKIYNPVAQWTSGHNDAPVQTIDLPDGVYRGITVSPDGQHLFVSDYENRKILKYTGSPSTGYTADPGFSFELGVADTVPAGSNLLPGPVNLAYMSPNNILFAAVDVHGYSSGTHGTYSYGKIYLLHPMTGELVSTDSSLSIIDAAAWNFDAMGSYTARAGGTVPGNASGYTSTFDVAFDENGNVYTQSHYGWTIDKWEYNGTLPIISSVERVSNAIPQAFRLEQNYPNPFNPATIIEFTVLKSGHVSLRIHDILGREVVVLTDGMMEQGTYRTMFDAGDLTGGVYFYTLRTNHGSMTKKMTLVK
ncbi:MAG: T9SS type A sorting domain-containing protein [Ignavibacteriales bacterium]|nr:T9SS type A sorting domain-containing protein [Ignavibacteriales bacterium]